MRSICAECAGVRDGSFDDKSDGVAAGVERPEFDINSSGRISQPGEFGSQAVPGIGG